MRDILSQKVLIWSVDVFFAFSLSKMLTSVRGVSDLKHCDAHVTFMQRIKYPPIYEDSGSISG